MAPENQLHFETDLDGLRPLTDEASKTVMIAGERGDSIRIDTIVQRFNDPDVPSELSVIRRHSKYYGPELVLHSEVEEEMNYRLVAPGPGSSLHLWQAEKTETGVKESYVLLAEVKATLLGGSYEMCPDCGEPFKTRRHEQLAAIGRCPNQQSKLS